MGNHLERYRSSSSGRSSIVPSRADRLARRAENEITEAGLMAMVDVEVERIEARAFGEAVATSLEIELEFVDHFTERAGNSAVKQHLFANKLSVLANGNDSRLRRFGR